MSVVIREVNPVLYRFERFPREITSRNQQLQEIYTVAYCILYFCMLDLTMSADSIEAVPRLYISE